MNQIPGWSANAEASTALDELLVTQMPDADIALFKKAMRRLTATVTLIATEHEGTPYGMAATAVSSVCTSPAVDSGVHQSQRQCLPAAG